MDKQQTDATNGKNKRANETFYKAIGDALGVAHFELRQYCGQQWGGRFTDSEGRRFDVRPDWRNGERLHVDGDYPRTQDGKYAADCYGDKKNPAITVAITRPPDKIAADITRRFLPGFADRWAEVAKRAAATDESDNKRQANRARLISLIDGASISVYSECRVWAPSPYHECEAQSDGVSISVRYVPMALGEQIISVVEQWRREHPDDE